MRRLVFVVVLVVGALFAAYPAHAEQRPCDLRKYWALEHRVTKYTELHGGSGAKVERIMRRLARIESECPPH